MHGEKEKEKKILERSQWTINFKRKKYKNELKISKKEKNGLEPWSMLN